jgi:hypothetical protein
MWMNMLGAEVKAKTGYDPRGGGGGVGAATRAYSAKMLERRSARLGRKKKATDPGTLGGAYLEGFRDNLMVLGSALGKEIGRQRQDTKMKRTLAKTQGGRPLYR